MSNNRWEADHQRRALEALGLADEFNFGCDSISVVAEALLAARAEVERLKAGYEYIKSRFTGVTCEEMEIEGLLLCGNGVGVNLFSMGMLEGRRVEDLPWIADYDADWPGDEGG